MGRFPEVASCRGNPSRIAVEQPGQGPTPEAQDSHPRHPPQRAKWHPVAEARFDPVLRFRRPTLALRGSELTRPPI